MLLLQLCKYLPIPETFTGYFFKFNGPLTAPAKPTNEKAVRWQPNAFKNAGIRIEKDFSFNPELPREHHLEPIVAYGK